MTEQEEARPQVDLTVALHWLDLAHLSPAALHGRIALALSLLQRLDATDDDVLLVTRALQGWTVEELFTGASAVQPPPTEGEQ